MLKAQRPVNIGDHIPYVICDKTEAEVEAEAASKAASVKAEQETPPPKGSMSTIPARTQAASKAGSSKGAAERARHPDDVARSEGKLNLDYEWYLTQQILPPISRLCEPIEGTSTMQLSAKLGLDASKTPR